jgi:hypothetical protein
MSEPIIRNPFAGMFGKFIKVDNNKYVSDFVKKQHALSARIVSRLIWDSSPDKNGKGRTYIKKLHGNLI